MTFELGLVFLMMVVLMLVVLRLLLWVLVVMFLLLMMMTHVRPVFQRQYKNPISVYVWYTHTRSSSGGILPTA